MKPPITPAVIALVAAIAHTPARACPVCDSDQGREVRAGVFDENFSLNVAQLLVVFPLTAAILVLACRCVPVSRAVASPSTRGHDD